MARNRMGGRCFFLVVACLLARVSGLLFYFWGLGENWVSFCLTYWNSNSPVTSYAV